MIDSCGVFFVGCEGDVLVNCLIDEEVELFGCGIMNFIYIFSLEFVVIGGGFVNEFDRLYFCICDCIFCIVMLVFCDVLVVYVGLG